MAHYEIYEDDAGEHRWRLVADNGEIVAVGEGHSRAEDALRAVGTAKLLFAEAVQPGEQVSYRWDTESFSFTSEDAEDAIQEAKEAGDEVREVEALFGTPTLLNELWDRGLLYLVNSLLHHFGYAFGVHFNEGTAEDGAPWRKAYKLTLHKSSDPEGIWFDEKTTKYGRAKLLKAGMVGGGGGLFTIADIEQALPVLEKLLKDDPEKATVWALPMLLAGHSPYHETDDSPEQQGD